METLPDPFDHNYWVNLFRTDPAAFKKQKLEVIEAYIATIPAERQEKQRKFFQDVQFLMDAAEEDGQEPEMIAVTAFSLMTNHFLGENGMAQTTKLWIELGEHLQRVAEDTAVIRQTAKLTRELLLVELVNNNKPA